MFEHGPGKIQFPLQNIFEELDARKVLKLSCPEARSNISVTYSYSGEAIARTLLEELEG